MNTPEARRRIATFFRSRAAALDVLSRRGTQLLELLALTAVVSHYERAGFRTAPANLKAGRYKVRLTTSGLPQNFSYYTAERSDAALEIHSNIAIRGSSTVDDGRYVVDVGVVLGNSVPRHVNRGELAAADNSSLVTFVEAKHLVIYPMLLAQFVGTVHELMPAHIHNPRPPGYDLDPHFAPALVAIRYLSANARSIVEGYPKRDYWITIIPDLHARVIRAEAASTSPFAPPAVQANDE